jgi:transcriptional regulator with XRE-family HTH domain
MDKREIFKRELPKYMNKAGMKQIDLAKALGMSKSTVHCWITGKAFPEIDTVQRIADVLGCETDDLLVDQSEKKPNRLMDLLITEPQSFDPSVFSLLRDRLKPQTPKEDAEMVVLWRSASVTAKRAAIAVLKSMEGVK